MRRQADGRRVAGRDAPVAQVREERVDERGSVGARAARRTPVTALRASVRAAPTSSGCSAWYVASASTTDACTLGAEGVRDAPLADRDAAVRTWSR